MGLSMEIKGSALVALPDCEIDHHSTERLRAQIDAAFDKSSCRHIIMDFSQVGFMDSSGIGMIIGRYKSTEKRGGQLCITGMNSEMQRLFNLSGLAKIITRTDTVDDALKNLQTERELA